MEENIRRWSCLTVTVSVLGDGAVDVGDDHLVLPAPQVDGALAATRPLVLGGDTEGDVVGSVSQLQFGLRTEC